MLHALRILPLLLLLAAPLPARADDGPLSALGDAELLQLLEPSAELQGRCGTPVLAELSARGLSAPVLALAAGDTLYYDTPEGRFRVAYVTEGVAAVDPTDLDLSGVPDYVELTGRAFERSWSVEVDSLGFSAPDLAGERYFVSTIYSAGYFGQTVPSSTRPGGSYIEVNHSMDAFCGASDPPDCLTNALLSTVAHEFKHAIQIASGWAIFSVGTWIELDASWIEDLVFDDSNDYYRFLGALGSPFTAPTQSLASTPSYQDCTWQHYLSENFGPDFLVDFADRVAATQFVQKAQLAYLDVASQRGLDWPALWGGYSVANFLTAQRSATGLGFEEGAFYPLAASEAVLALPWNSGLRGLEDMAMRFHVFAVAPEAAAGGVRVTFSGSATTAWTVRAVYQNPGQTLVVEIPVVDGQASVRPPHAVEDFQTFAVVVGNPRVPPVTPSSATYSLGLGLEPIPTQPTSLGGFKGRYRRPAGQ